MQCPYHPASLSHAPLLLPYRKLEDLLDQKTAELITLRKAAFEHNSKAAVRDAVLESAAEGRGGEADWAIPAMRQNGGGQQQAAAAFGGPQVVAESEWGGSEASSPLVRRYGSGSGEWGCGGGGASASAPAAAVEALQRQLEDLRLHAGREAAAATEREAAWRQQAEKLQARLAATQQQQQQRSPQASGPNDGGPGSAAALAAQCDALGKEREALRTILDSKVCEGRGGRGDGGGWFRSEQELRIASLLSKTCTPPTACVPALCLPTPVQVRVLVDDIGRSMGELPPEVSRDEQNIKLGVDLNWQEICYRTCTQAPSSPPVHHPAHHALPPAPPSRAATSRYRRTPSLGASWITWGSW